MVILRCNNVVERVKDIMEAVRRYVNSDELMSILSLPEKYRNHKREIIVIPAEEKHLTEKSEKSKILNSLIGAIPTTNLSLEELEKIIVDELYIITNRNTGRSSIKSLDDIESYDLELSYMGNGVINIILNIEGVKLDFNLGEEQ